MHLAIQYKENASCAGNIVVQNCSFQMVTVRYPVIINANQSTVAFDPQSTMFDDIVETTIDLGGDELEGAMSSKVQQPSVVLHLQSTIDLVLMPV